MIAGLIFAIGGFIEVLIGLRFIFLLLGANPASGFVQWIYDWSAPLVAPFAGVFGHAATVRGPGVVIPSVFDWAALVALIVYGLILALLGRVFARSRA